MEIKKFYCHEGPKLVSMWLRGERKEFANNGSDWDDLKGSQKHEKTPNLSQISNLLTKYSNIVIQWSAILRSQQNGSTLMGDICINIELSNKGEILWLS